jgi:glycerol kinase
MYVLALDQGTTSSRAILFDREGSVKAADQKEFEQLFPRPGWVEHRPEDIWLSQAEVMRGVLEKAGISPRELAAIGITNQRETTVLWDRRTGEPVGNAIVWQDRRTTALCDRLRSEGKEAFIQERTGLVLDAYFAGTKIAWILNEVEGAREKAEAGELAFGTVDSWLVWKLTGCKRHLTDTSNASRTLLFNIHTNDWDDELLALFGIPRSLLPEVRASSEVYGETVPGILASPVPIAGIAGDQQAALFGQMCIEPGMSKNTYGTGCFLLLYTGREPVASQNRLLTTVAWKIGDETHYALEGSIFIAGAVVQWLRDGLGIIRSSAEVEELAASVPDHGGVYLVPAFAGLGAPHWDGHARGTIVGMTRGTTAGHLARAALESIAYQVADVLEAMQIDSGLRESELRVDGGAAANDLLMQFQADVIGIPVVRPRVLETTARGAAYLAGLAVGFWKSQKEIADQWDVERRFEPTIERDTVERLRRGWRKALGRAKSWEDTDTEL